MSPQSLHEKKKKQEGLHRRWKSRETKRGTKVTEIGTARGYGHRGLHGQRENVGFPGLGVHLAEAGPMAGWRQELESQLPSEMPPEDRMGRNSPFLPLVPNQARSLVDLGV